MGFTTCSFTDVIAGGRSWLGQYYGSCALSNRPQRVTIILWMGRLLNGLQPPTRPACRLERCCGADLKLLLSTAASAGHSDARSFSSAQGDRPEYRWCSVCGTLRFRGRAQRPRRCCAAWRGLAKRCWWSGETRRRQTRRRGQSPASKHIVSHGNAEDHPRSQMFFGAYM